MTALWYIAQALGVLLNAAIIQIPMSLVYQFFLYFCLMVIITALFVAINCRTCYPRTNTHQSSNNSSTHEKNVENT